MADEDGGARVGANVRLIKSIFDDGEDHHLGQWIAKEGEVLVVQQVHADWLSVAHAGNNGSFKIYPGEYESI